MQKIEIKCKGADSLPIDTIKDFQGKLKRITKDNLERLKVSILKNGFVAPIFIWQHEGRNMALDGHQRIKALLSMRDEGYDIPLLPVAYIEADNEEDARQKLLAITSQYGEFDLDELNSWVSNLDAEIAETLRFVDDKIELDIEEIETEGDDEFEDKIDPITQLGDLWELGNHRVLCGDSTDSNTIEILMNNKRTDIIFTDPPYGMFLDADFSSMKRLGTGNKYDNVKGDHADFDPLFISSIFKHFPYCKEIFLWGADYYIELIPERNKGCFIVWDKMKGGEGVNDNYNKMFGSNFELCWSKSRHKRAIARVLWKGIFGLQKEDTKSRVHPTQKPTELVIWFLNKFSNYKEMVLDLFIGSGSTLIACEKTNRICYGMEIDPYYCDVIVKRYMDWCIKNEREYIVKLNGESWQ